MNDNHQDDFSKHVQSKTILIASIGFIVTALMPNLLDTMSGLKITWFWQQINFSQTSVAIKQIIGIVVVFIPLLIYLLLSKRNAVITILVYMIALSIYAITQAHHNPLIAGMQEANEKSAIMLTVFFMFILMAVASRLTLSQPTCKYPFRLLFITSQIFILLTRH